MTWAVKLWLIESSQVLHKTRGPCHVHSWIYLFSVPHSSWLKSVVIVWIGRTILVVLPIIGFILMITLIKALRFGWFRNSLLIYLACHVSKVLKVLIRLSLCLILFKFSWLLLLLEICQIIHCFFGLNLLRHGQSLMRVLLRRLNSLSIPFVLCARFPTKWFWLSIGVLSEILPWIKWLKFSTLSILVKLKRAP